ncbi:MAG: PAS domain S-box protein [Crinalium sp.]
MLRGIRDRTKHYLISLGIVASALLLTFLLKPLLGTINFPLFYWAVAVSAWSGGMEAGLLATLLSTLAIQYFFIAPLPNFAINDLTHLVRLGVFILVTLLISSLNWELRAAKQRIEKSLLKIKASEEQYRLIVDTAYEGIWKYNSEAKTEYVNQRLAEMLGYTPEEMIGRPVFDFIDRDQRGQVEQILQRRKQGIKEQYDFCFRCKDNSELWAIVTSSPIIDQNGESIGGIAMLTDVTERKQAELALKESEARFRSIVESNMIGIAFWESDGSVKDPNAAFLNIIGYTQEDVIPNKISWQKLTPPEYSYLDTLALTEIKTNRFCTPFEKEYIRKDGSRVPVLIGGGSFEECTDKGAFFVLDITKRKLAEKALRESESRLKHLVDSNLIGIIFADFNGNVIEANDAWLNILGYTREEVISGKINFLEITPPEYRHLDQLAIEEMKLTNKHSPFEKEYIRKDGSRIPVLIGTAYIPGDEPVGIGFLIDLSERKQIEKAREQSETRFRTLVEQAPLSIQILAPDGRTLQVNRAWEELWGVTLDQIPEYNMLEDQQLEEKGIIPYIKQAFAGEAVIIPPAKYDPNESIPDRTINQDPIRWVSAVAYPVKNEDGSIREIVVIHEDRTARKRAEDTLKEREAELSLITNTVPVLISYIDAEQRYRFNNQKYQEWFGNSPTEIYGKHIREVLGVTAYQKFLPYIETVLSGQQVTFEAEIPYQNIGKRYVNAIYIPQFGDNKQVKGFVALVSDITERKQAEVERIKLLELEQAARIVAVNEAARSATAQQRLAFLAEASRVLSSSLDYKIILSTIADLVVPSMADFCFFDAVTPENKIERVVWRHCDPDQKEWFDQVQYYVPPQDIQDHPVNSVLLTGKAQFISKVSDDWLQEVAINSEHLNFWRSLNFSSLITVPIIAHDRKLGTLTFCVTSQSDRSYTNDDLLLAYDLAHRAALALDNASLYREAQEANRMKDEFLATLSHELRTPLNAMLGWTQLLRTRTFDPQTSARALETIDRNTKSLAQLIEDVLDVSRIITGKLQLNIRPIQLVPVIEAAIETVQPAANAKDIKIECLLDFYRGKVLGDPNRLQQVVWNLLSNAVKFTPQGGRVEVRLKQINNDVYIEFIDTGKGIKNEFLPYVFERFRQADNSITRSYGGLGLGLAIVRHLVELHGGTVHAESAGEGKGATFVVILPAIAHNHNQVKPETSSYNQNIDLSPSTDSVSSSLLSDLHILIVDDEPDARELLIAILQDYGAEVTAANSATEAFELLQKLQPNVLISDIGMPNEDGYALIRKIRSLHPEQGGKIPAIALTAYARSEDRNQAILAGFQLHIPKPINPAELAIMISNLLTIIN